MPVPPPENPPFAAATNDLRVRRATVDDLAAVVELENASFAVERMSARQLRRHLDSASALIMVATAQRRLLGAAVLFLRSRSRVGRLYSIAVAAGARGRGIGEALLQAVERAAAKRGCDRLRLEVRVDNAGAQRLYERHGYHRFGLRRGYYEDGHDALRYEKPLA